ncbi:AMP-binding protein [uncultured Sulfitobacter sp.]|uniref:AMP-binding protein n=1 Tax=uncultured Sulfitobacter sp. TaxID=191468 RepID=UPI002634291E|nr:AMP-binding protein [uncultured Sulfitobacter sp.]
MLAALIPANIDPQTVLAVDDTGETLHYGDLDALRATWATKISGRRLVAVLCANTVPMFGAYIGLQAAGHAVILLSSKIAPEALEDLIARYKIEAVVGPEGVELLAEPAGGLHDDLSVCLSTSGSTGSPKLVRFSTAQLAANAVSIADYLDLEADDAPLAHLPFEYSFGLSVLHSHMAVGATLLLTEHSVMQKPFWERLKEATSIAGVPFHFEMLLRMRLGRADLPKMRTLVQAGGKLGPKEAQTLYDMAHDKGWKFHIMYGQTEAGPRISWLPFDRMAGHFDCIGQPIPGVTLEISDDGDLVVNSPAIMMGYAEGRADLAQGDVMDGVLHTGDLAERVEGLYRITGRKSRFIKLQGNRVSLGDVETRLQSIGHPVCCAGRDDALVIFTENSDTDVVRTAAIAQFSFPARSLDVRHLAAFPRRSNDKIDYGALQALSELEG